MKDPWQHIPSLLERVKAEYLRKTYGVEEWDDAEDFLAKLAAKTGKLLKVFHSLHEGYSEAPEGVPASVRHLLVSFEG